VHSQSELKQEKQKNIVYFASRATVLLELFCHLIEL